LIVATTTAGAENDHDHDGASPLSNRHARRRDVREFRREVHRGFVITHLIDVHSDLAAFPMLAQVVAAWGAAIPHRKPFCFCCRASFVKNARPGAYLFAVSPGAADIASVSALCVECWHELPRDDIERAAVRLLQQFVPHGRFLGRRSA
jgi:hypothetical protein